VSVYPIKQKRPLTIVGPLQAILPLMWIRTVLKPISTSWPKKFTPELISLLPNCSTTSTDSWTGSRGFERLVSTGYALRATKPADMTCVLALGIDVPIIPGIMPIQNYASFKRLTNLCKCPVPEEVLNDLDVIKVSIPLDLRLLTNLCQI
jgi:hypothetical protein